MSSEEMKFVVDITNLNNAAFDDNGKSGEIARILRDVAAKLETGRYEGNALDINGNTVGMWGFEPKH
jgi:hypothetical protein